MDFSIFFSILTVHLTLYSVDAIWCSKIFDRSSVQELNACMELLFAPSQTIPEDIWNERLPTVEQRQDIAKLIRRIYLASDYEVHCNAAIILEYQSLLGVIEVTRFKDIYCVIHEPIPENGQKYFSHFWGYVVIANPLNATKGLHHSAAHFKTDGDVCNQAAYIFENTKSRSLVIAGAARDAVISNASSPCQKSSPLADAAHDNRTMFHAINVAIRDASQTYDTPQDFIQWHGMAETSCTETDVFMSAGAIGNASVYKDKDALVNLLRSGYNKVKGGAETPHTGTGCSLTARTNIFGRYINGVPFGSECSQDSVNEDVRGAFVHIEQKRKARDDWETWVTVINEAFKNESDSSPPFCAIFSLIFYLVLLNIAMLSI